MDPKTPDALITTKMAAAGLGAPTIHAFLTAVRQVREGATGLVPESTIEPVETLPRLDDVPDPGPGATVALRQLAVIKLNGGLGTGMGLDGPKSLLPIKGSDTFLDFIARQILHLRGGRGTEPAFYLMDSFSTRRQTLEHLQRYPDLASDGELDFLQNMVPKLDARTLEPVSWPADPDLEWCPPGHGDLYPALLGSGLLQRLLNRGIRLLFVSNSDNLGATVDLRLVDSFARSGLSFLMEVAERTAADRKGGHLARRRDNGRLLLRESAQTPKEDEPAFQDIERHRFFNTNNLWIRLDDLAAELDARGGSLPLPLIRNAKTVDPRDPSSPKVVQLESAMGAAIETFPRSGAMVVPRSRFAPVKTTSDLLALRSDAYVITPDHRVLLSDRRRGQPSVVELDGRFYKVLTDFDRWFPDGVPSLAGCDSLKVAGAVRFAGGVVCEGNVEIRNPGPEPATLAAGAYRDTVVTLS